MGKEPPTLYNQCLLAYVKNLNHNVASLDRIAELRLLPTVILAAVYDQMCNFDSLQDILLVQLTDLDTFHKLIKQTSLKQIMFKCVQTLMTGRRPIVTELRTKFCRATTVYYLQNANASAVKDASLEGYLSGGDLTASGECPVAPDNWRFVSSFMDQIDNGVRLGSFLSESGWLEESLHVLNITLGMIQLLRNCYMRSLIELNCLQKLLCAQTAFCCFKEASITVAQALNIIDKLTQQHQQQMRQRMSSAKAGSSSRSSSDAPSHHQTSGTSVNGDVDRLSNIPNSLLANMFHQISVLHFYRSEYDLSYRWSIRALKHVNKHTPDKIVVDVVRQMAKSCVVKRQFQSASMLIKQAVCRARASFGTNHQKYANALLDYGFILLNVDSIANSVAVYSEAHEILCRIFGSRNLHVAVAHEDLAYCLYVLEYSSGKFESATANVERAIDIMKELVPCNHLMLASAKRVKALILEEIALDTMASSIDYQRCKNLLEQSEELHRSALHLSLDAFGEINVQTAKHYGNLGRLYQSMAKFDDAEQMHKRAINIKTHILGPYDYEVGLSIGHLASLYNYHMQKHQEAEELYLKSIEISLRLFGEAYSGLEYDYRGLIHIYEITGAQARYDLYSNILEEWRILREDNQVNKNNFPAEITEDTTMEEVTRKFFEMCSNSPCLTGGDPLTDSGTSLDSHHPCVDIDDAAPDSGESGIGEEPPVDSGEDLLVATASSSAEEMLRSM
ncbi:amyloid protein-binding protein 2-like [Malaya genurostris]|uniref:amyloid protein-binding protein 2-like n=1 Tax=Malaya genurostris TaxID=325434 RepID=UPI0026F3C446|nr:amyloid protein-binding protein 2-like [Malaya genurostris]XP_058444932.1 amyloid protein-binding protein 2-like [Malaya genurostris]